MPDVTGGVPRVAAAVTATETAAVAASVATSDPLNLAEGLGRSGRDRHHHWWIAYGSAKEEDCHRRLLVHAGAINRERTGIALRLFDEVRATTWRLLHPKA